MNQHSPPSRAQSDSGSAELRPRGPSLLESIQTAWNGTGISLLTLTIFATVAFEGSIRSLLESDDAYAASFAASVPVAVLFALGCAAGWRFRSSRVATIATAVSVAGFAALLWASDYAFDFGEGDGIFGYLAIGIALGGSSGLLAFTARSTSAKLVLSIAPHLLFGVGYSIALSAMSAMSAMSP